MDCKRYEAALRAHALGEPPSPALEAHLASCAACRETLAVGRGLQTAIDNTLDRLRQIEPSRAFLARARTAAGDASLASPRLGWLDRVAWSPVLAVVVLALGLGVIVARGPRSPEPPRPTLPSSPPASARPPLPELAASISRPPAVSPLPDAPHRARAPEDRLLVLVPPGQEEAIVRLARLVAAGAVAPPASLVDPPDPSRPLTPPAELSFPPLAIEPLDPGAGKTEGVMP